MPTIGLVTVLYKSDALLADFFKSVSIQTYTDYILYLVDNSVNEVSNVIIENGLAAYPITLHQHIKNTDNVGVAEGNNIGIKKALADGCSHILLLNNDIAFEQNYVFSMMLALTENNLEHIVVPKIYYYGGATIWLAGGYIDKWRALGVHYGLNKKDAPQYNIARHCNYSPTCFMLITKEVFEKTGLIDEKYFAYYDDTDFVFRACKNGFKILYEPSLNIQHKVSSSTGTNSPFYVYYSNRNKIYFIRKNFIGLQRYFAIGYTLLSRVVFYLRFDKVRKQKLVQGLKDGFKIQINKTPVGNA